MMRLIVWRVKMSRVKALAGEHDGDDQAELQDAASAGPARLVEGGDRAGE